MTESEEAPEGGGLDDFHEQATEFVPIAKIPRPPKPAAGEGAGAKAGAGGDAAVATAPESKLPGCLYIAAWWGLGFLGTIAAAVLVGVAGSKRESDGISAAIAAAFPTGFLWAGSIGALLFHFMTPKNKAARFGGPFGCGCLGGVVLLALVFVFFATIFKSL